MRKGTLLALAAIMLAVVAPGPHASAERLVFAVSSHRVLINSSFTGAELILFGVVEQNGVARQGANYDIVATVTGPKQDVVTRRKERVVGIWVNAASRTFAQAPAYLAVLANRELDQIAGAETRKRQQIGLANAALPGDGGAPDDEFRTAFLRLNVERQLYREEPKAVTFLTANLFRASIGLPANVATGVYKVEVKLFLDGEVLASQDSFLEIVKVGFEQFVANAARDHGLAYGLSTVALAALTGWLAAFVFRRD
jgi:uncharacterized protein (TIGR02186 family)